MARWPNASDVRMGMKVGREDLDGDDIKQGREEAALAHSPRRSEKVRSVAINQNGTLDARVKKLDP